MVSTMGWGFVVLLLTLLFSVCSAGQYCYKYNSYSSNYGTYCVYGCCGYSNSYCCAGPATPVGLITGLSVGIAVFVFFVILIICICRRRRYGGFIYGSQPATAVVVQQQTTMNNQNGIVTTAGVQPGVTYPPYQQYPYYPPTTGYPAAVAAQQNFVTPPPNFATAPPGYGYPSQAEAYPAEPPKYDALNYGVDGGLDNRGFDAKNPQLPCLSSSMI